MPRHVAEGNEGEIERFYLRGLESFGQPFDERISHLRVGGRRRGHCRFHAVDLVESAGYKAVQAANVDEAIAFLEARKDIRIVFTDIDMPGSMDGLKLAHAIRKRWPPIELILTSGLFDISDDEMPERGRFFFEAVSRSRGHHGAALFCGLARAQHLSPYPFRTGMNSTS